MDWKPYIKDRLIAEHEDGFFVIVPASFEPAVPLSCEICDRLFRTHDDKVAYKEFQCCHLCAMKWAHPRRDKWKEDGWRPAAEQVKEDVANRPPLFIEFDFFEI